MTGEEAQREVLAILKLFTFLDDEPGVFDEWHRLVAQYDVRGKKAHDARFVAAMRRRGITHLLTFNTTDFRRYSEITILSPTDVAQNPPSN
jgi:predicted nucleic acid-binding protein